jgi:hypothetical protein
MDWSQEKHCHPGVIKAVYDTFGKNFSIIEDKQYGHNIWCVRV